MSSQFSQDHLHAEWLVTNGLGGYSSGTFSGALTRKYHGLFVAALPAPFGRTVMLNYVDDQIVFSDKTISLSALQTGKHQKLVSHLTEYRLEDGLPIWIYDLGEAIVEKRILMIYKQNTVQIIYKIVSSSQPLKLRWRPYMQFRMHEETVNAFRADEYYTIYTHDHHHEVNFPPFPSLKLYTHNLVPFVLDSHVIENVFYSLEDIRGYESTGKLTSPGYYELSLSTNEKATFIASTEPWEAIHAFTSDDIPIIEKIRRNHLLKTAAMHIQRSIPKSSIIEKLIFAADQFIITPISRMEDMIRLRAVGEETKSIIAGYPWFTDWGRDTMISLEGLTICTGRVWEARSILLTFAYYVKNGLIPNMFPDGEKEGLYHTADATLWFFHAAHRYIQVTKDTEILELLLPKFREILHRHVEGTSFGIYLDRDGLLVQGTSSNPLTWMDAKMGDWIVTPRRGKAVEINALWYNALKIFENWSGTPLPITQQCYETFNKRFWNSQEECLYDVVDGEQGNDASIRPNQLFAISLDYPILERQHWQPVINKVSSELLTPYGLRTLSPKDPNYKYLYSGDLRARDAAYHQGIVWPWLIGPFIDSWLKVYPEDIQGAHNLLKNLSQYIQSDGIGTMAEIFDANDPHHARGCFAQAWSVAEVLRCLLKTVPFA